MPSEFWEQYGAELGDKAVLIWAHDDQPNSTVDMAVVGRTGYFRLGWLTFMIKHNINCGDTIKITYTGKDSTFLVSRPRVVEPAEDDEEPEQVVEVSSDGEEEDEEEQVEVVELSSDDGEDEYPEFWRRYPKFKYNRQNELGFCLKKAPFMNDQPSLRKWVIEHRETNRRWMVTVNIIRTTKRVVFTSGWSDVRTALNIEWGDIVKMVVVDKHSNPPLMRIKVAKLLA